MTVYQIKIEHDVPTWTQFKKWNISEASPDTYLKISFFDGTECFIIFEVIFQTYYYCSGSHNAELNGCSVVKTGDTGGRNLIKTLESKRTRNKFEKVLDDSFVDIEEVLECLRNEL